ncbi:MAG: GDP-mannose 4,6-dehydratase [Candidatus Woesearchaeota archaeon]
MKILITGGLGFLGSNLAAEALKEGEKVLIIDNLFKPQNFENIKWIKQFGNFDFKKKDIRNWQDVRNLIKKFKPDAVFHAAGQVAMTTSIINPRIDFEINALGTLNVLEAVRLFCPSAAVIFSSTNKVYGDLNWVRYKENETRYIAEGFPNGFDERIPLEFHSPYGCSKGCADQYMLDYHRVYGLKTVVFRHSSMYGERQFPTYDQGWIGWFVGQAIKIKENKIKEIEIHGTGKQVRDVLFCDDVVKLYFTTLRRINKCAGQVFNIGGGMRNSLSLLELFQFLERELNIKIKIIKKAWRESDQKVFVANNSKIEKFTGWKPKVGKEEGIKKMIEWMRKNE